MDPCHMHGIGMYWPWLGDDAPVIHYSLQTKSPPDSAVVSMHLSRLSQAHTNALRHVLRFATSIPRSNLRDAPEHAALQELSHLSHDYLLPSLLYAFNCVSPKRAKLQPRRKVDE